MLAAAQETRIGGSWLRQLSGTRSRLARPPSRSSACRRSARPCAATKRGINQQLYTVLLRKQEMLARVRRDVAYKARLDLWLYLHVPASIALLGALIAHVLQRVLLLVRRQ